MEEGHPHQNHANDDDENPDHNPPVKQPFLESWVFPDEINAANDASTNDEAGT